ncbi:MAG: hypothetical protein K8R54_12025 [Bacteroidales bacterium]|nr:hypothetical protein [Bacteroidales bacterium]
MGDKNIYIRDYYFLQREKEEKDFVEFLNSNTDLFKLANPYIIQIKDFLFEKIKNKQPTINIEISDDKDVAFLMQIKQNKAVKTIDNNKIKEHLFSLTTQKLINRLFKKDGFNDEKFIVQNHIHNWFELLLAKSIISDERFSTYNILKNVIRQAEMLHNFYNYLIENIPIKWINNDNQNWIDVDFNNLSEAIDPIIRFNDFFIQYEEALNKYENLSPFSYINKTTENSEYTMFSEEYRFRSNVLYKKDLPKWIKFWDNLKLPILQDIPFYFKTPHEILIITDAVIKNKEILKSNISHLACILAKTFFDNTLKITENLIFYTDIERIKSISKFQYNKELIIKGKELAINWNNEKVKLYSSFMSKIIDLLNFEDIEEWVFSYKYRTTPQNEYTERYNSEIDILISSFSKIVGNNIEIRRNFNLQKFNFYANVLRNTKTHIEAEDLLNELLYFIDNNDFYWDNSFVEPYWKTFKNIGYLLSIIENSTEFAISSMLNKVKVFYEGWNINSVDYKITKKEIFVLNGLLMLFEHPDVFKNKTQKKEYFKLLLKHIVTQYRFSGFNNSDYIINIELISLIVNQIYNEKKQYFEKEIIDNIDNIEDVLKIFGVDKYKLEKKSLEKLKPRIDKELLIYKRKIDRRNNKQEIENIDIITEKMGLK